MKVSFDQNQKRKEKIQKRNKKEKGKREGEKGINESQHREIAFQLLCSVVPVFMNQSIFLSFSLVAFIPASSIESLLHIQSFCLLNR
jgi:hypothetical protein